MKIVDIDKLIKNTPFIKRKIEEILPELIKKLIKATSKSIEFIRFPSGDAVNVPGLDGVVVNNTENCYIPVGKSFWELGTSDLKKINSDYDKRTKELDYDIRKEITFVLVIPKNWHFKTRSADWIAERLKDWKNVIVCEANIINDWLEDNLEISLWLLNEINITQSKLNCDLLPIALDKTLSSTNPNLNKDIFVEGRKKNQDKLLETIKNQHVIYVKSESRFDSFGFILSTLIEVEDDEISDKILIINDRASLNYCNDFLNEKIFIINFDEIENIKQTTNKLIIPICKYNTMADGIILETRGQRLMSRLLSEIGLDSQKSNDVNFLSKGNMLIIRRLLAKDVVEQKPQWAALQDKHILLPILFLQKFEIDNIAHIKFAEYLLNMDFNTIFIKWKDFEQIEDPPFRIVDNVLQFLNIEEGWFILNSYLTKNDYQKLFSAILFYICKKEPESDRKLESDGFGKKNLECILSSLTLYAMSNTQNQTIVDCFIRDILKCHIENFERILTFIHALAECSPGSVIDFIENDLLYGENIKNTMLTNDYTKILWTLEYLSTLRQYKFRSLNTLFELTKLDIKYQYSNNPETSFINLLNPYFNISALSLEDKKSVIKKFFEDDYVFVNLYLKIITINSCGYGIGYNVRKQELCEDVIYQRDIYNFYKELNSLMIEKIILNKDLTVVEKIIDNYHYFFIEDLDALSNYIKENRSYFDDEILYNVYKTSIHEAARIRRFEKHENWKDNANYLEVLLKIVKVSEPNEVFIKYKYLFENDYDDVDIEEYNCDDEKDFEYVDSRREELKQNAIKIIKQTYGNNALSLFIDVLEDSSYWGSYFIKSFSTKESLELMIKECFLKNKLNLLAGFICSYENTDESIMLLKNVGKEKLRQILPLLYNLKMESLCEDDEDRRIFYSNKSYGYRDDLDLEIFNNFLKFNPVGCLDYFIHKVIDGQTYELAITTLSEIKKDNSLIKTQRYEWELKELFKKLEGFKLSDEIALLELDFINHFEHLYPKALTNYWFNNPKEFIEYCESVYCKERRYKELYNLEYKLVFDEKQFDNFKQFEDFSNYLIQYATSKNEDRKFILSILGNILSKSPKGKDGAFPHESARRILEKKIDSTNRGFLIGYYNSRGARMVTDGTSEFEKAKTFEQYAANMEIMYPTTAILLRKIAKDFDNTGKDDKKYDLLGY